MMAAHNRDKFPGRTGKVYTGIVCRAEVALARVSLEEEGFGQ